MEMDKKRRAVELLKDVLILLLTCSAIWLAAQTPLAAPFKGLLREEGVQTAPGQMQVGDRGAAALPLAMVANLPAGVNLPAGFSMPEGSEGVRCGIQYDQTACQELFQKVAGPLVEVLSSAGDPDLIGRGQWARTRGKGLRLD